MDINRNNYEAYLLDLMEGSLTAEEARQVRDFLLLNPDCAEGLNAENIWSLEPSTLVLAEKNSLKKNFPNPSTPLTNFNFDMYSIARLEGDLTRKQEEEHEHLVMNNEARKKEWGAWQQTRLVSETMVYSRKDKLHKAGGKRNNVMWLSVVSAAAAVAMIISLIRTSPDLTDSSPVDPELLVESVAAPAESAPSPVILASEPVSLSIKKHQDPPELTGLDKVPAHTESHADSTSQSIQVEKIQSGPLKLALLPSYHGSIVEDVHFDRITMLDLPPVSSSSGNQVRSQLFEKGLRQTYKDFVKEKDLSLLTIASAGVDGINRLTGSDLSLDLSRNEGGEVSGFRFRADRITASFPLDKSD